MKKQFKVMGKYQQGSSLIEVMIAVIIFSIGMLGLAGLQIKTLKYNQDSMSRSTAVFLAYQMMDQMRANVAAAKAGDYDIDIGTEVTADTTSPVPTQDLAVWKSKLKDLLAGGQGSICRRPDTASDACTDAGDAYVVTVKWKVAGTGDTADLFDADSQTITVVGRL